MGLGRNKQEEEFDPVGTGEEARRHNAQVAEAQRQIEALKEAIARQKEEESEAQRNN